LIWFLAKLGYVVPSRAADVDSSLKQCRVSPPSLIPAMLMFAIWVSQWTKMVWSYQSQEAVVLGGMT